MIARPSVEFELLGSALLLVALHQGSGHGAHAGLVALFLGLEPGEHIGVEPDVDSLLWCGHLLLGATPGAGIELRNSVGRGLAGFPRMPPEDSGGGKPGGSRHGCGFRLLCTGGVLGCQGDSHQGLERGPGCC